MSKSDMIIYLFLQESRSNLIKKPFGFVINSFCCEVVSQFVNKTHLTFSYKAIECTERDLHLEQHQ